jgi:hypothetical protein
VSREGVDELAAAEILDSVDHGGNLDPVPSLRNARKNGTAPRS